MLISLVNLQLSINRAAEAIVRNHSANGVFDEQFRMATAARTHAFGFMTADEAGEAHEAFLLFLLAGDADLFRIDDHDEIAGVDMRSENDLVFATKEVGGAFGDVAENLVFSVDDPPLAGNVGGFG